MTDVQAFDGIRQRGMVGLRPMNGVGASPSTFFVMYGAQHSADVQSIRAARITGSNGSHTLKWAAPPAVFSPPNVSQQVGAMATLNNRTVYVATYGTTDRIIRIYSYTIGASELTYHGEFPMIGTGLYVPYRMQLLSTNEIYVCVAYVSGSDASENQYGIYKSTDGGATWNTPPYFPNYDGAWANNITDFYVLETGETTRRVYAIHQNMELIPDANYVIVGYTDDIESLVWTPIDGTFQKFGAGQGWLRPYLSQTRDSVHYIYTASPFNGGAIDTGFVQDDQTVFNALQGIILDGVLTHASFMTPVGAYHRIIMVESGTVYHSDDEGLTWHVGMSLPGAINYTFPARNMPKNVTYDAVKNLLVTAGADSANIYLTQDNALTWESLSIGVGNFVHGIAFSQ